MPLKQQHYYEFATNNSWHTLGDKAKDIFHTTCYYYAGAVMIYRRKDRFLYLR